MKNKLAFLLSVIALGFLVPASYAQVSNADLHREEWIRSDMVAFNPRYHELMAPRRKEFNTLMNEVYARERAGKVATCSHQIALETRMFMGYTADFPRIDKGLAALKDSLAHPEKEVRGLQEDPEDGSWGGCFTEWYERLDASYDVLIMKELQGHEPKYRFSLLDRVNSPEKIKAYFASITTSDIAHTGVDHRKELNAAYVDLIRLVVDGEPKGYHWNPGVKEALLNLTLDTYRNKKTGWWGETYIHNGKREYVDDLSMTFHIAKALHRNIPLQSEVAATLFAVKNVNYPVGWVDNGLPSNHNNMDVVFLMGTTWKEMTPAQQKEGAEDIGHMLHWCLTESLQPDGSFKPSPAGGDDSIEEGEHFGATFLANIGYFDKKQRFWTSKDFPEAEQNRQHIIHFIRSHMSTGATGGAYYSSALQSVLQ